MKKTLFFIGSAPAQFSSLTNEIWCFIKRKRLYSFTKNCRVIGHSGPTLRARKNCLVLLLEFRLFNHLFFTVFDILTKRRIYHVMRKVSRSFCGHFCAFWSNNVWALTRRSSAGWEVCDCKIKLSVMAIVDAWIESQHSTVRHNFLLCLLLIYACDMTKILILLHENSVEIYYTSREWCKRVYFVLFMKLFWRKQCMLIFNIQGVRTLSWIGWHCVCVCRDVCLWLPRLLVFSASVHKYQTVTVTIFGVLCSWLDWYCMHHYDFSAQHAQDMFLYVSLLVQI